MHYIDNFALSVLIYLYIMQNELIIECNNYESIEEIENFCSYINSISNLGEYKSYIKCTGTSWGFRLILTCEDNDRLNEFLNTYANLYKNDDLKQWGTNTFERFECLQQELLEKAKNTRTSLRRFNLEDIKFAPVILANFISNDEFIKDLTIETKESEDWPTPKISIFQYISDAKEEWTGIFHNWYNRYFNCMYELDMEWFLDTYNQSNTKTKQIRNKKDYPPQQFKMYSLIAKRVLENETRVIFEVEIRDILGIGYDVKSNNILNSAISSLNFCYREINNITDKKERLIRKQKNTDYYIISDNFQP